MGWWKADPVPEKAHSVTPAPSTSQPLPLSSTSNDASACPVDPKTRQIWMQQAQQRTQLDNKRALPQHHPNVEPTATKTFAAAPSEQCSSDRIDQSPSAPAPTSFNNLRPMSSEREVSTIPRAYPFQPEATATSSTVTSAAQAIPSNAEAETGHDKRTGNWIYPSESQFFTAVMRKQSEGQSQAGTSASDLAHSVSSIIPIHNAVNERAWYMIRKWEASHPSNKSCGGPKLLRFEGKGAGAKSPRAMMKSWAGYTEPFDRHDWTIQRCDGTEVEYVIDFYQGMSPAGQVSGSSQNAKVGGMGGLNFYLDVRPKLNSFEGCRLRFAQAVGWL